MDSLEMQLRRCTRSWRAWSGAAGTSVVLFTGIAATSITPERVAPPELPALSIARARPAALPPTLAPTPRPFAASELAEAFQFDPTNTGQPPEILLGQLDTSAFGGSLKFFDENASAGFDVGGTGEAGFAMTLDLRRTFEVEKPDKPNRYVVFERDQVDEIPVWLYGPQPRVPSGYDRKDWTVLVFYTVTERGRTENVFILDSTDPELNDTVKSAIAAWEFRPARKGGKAVKMWVQQAVNYSGQNKSPFSL